MNSFPSGYPTPGPAYTGYTGPTAWIPPPTSSPIFLSLIDDGLGTVNKLTIAVGVLGGLWVLTIGILLLLFFWKRRTARVSHQPAGTNYTVGRSYSDAESVKEEDMTMVNHRNTTHLIFIDEKKSDQEA